MEFIPRFFHIPQQSFFLLGPRGTGKSTLMAEKFPGALAIDLLSPETFRSMSARPETLRELVEGNPERKIVIIDEVQRAPEMLSMVHQLIEKHRDRQFILTGSSARKLRRSQTDLLAGRALSCALHPFMAGELGRAFHIGEAVTTGMLPLIRNAKDPQGTLKAYVSLYLREEVQAEGLVRNIGKFSRFLEAVSFSHGSVLNVSAVARECAVHRKVVEGYIDILEDLLIAFRIPVFTKRANRATSTHPKFYFFDAGVFRSLRPHGPLDRSAETEGAALEGLVAEHLRSWISYGNRDDALFFWRTRSGSEVDFVLYGPDGITAIEVKNGRTVGPGDLRNLRAFREDYPEARALLLYRGKERLLRNGILCMPCGDFLAALHPGEAIPEA